MGVKSGHGVILGNHKGSFTVREREMEFDNFTIGLIIVASCVAGMLALLADAGPGRKK